MTYLALDAWDVALAACLLLVPAALDLALRLGLTRSLLVAGIRSTLQLGLLGLVLRQVFALDRWWLVLPLLLSMVTVAARAATHRASRTMPGMLGAAWWSLVLATTLVTFTATELIVQTPTWWAPQYVIPLAGMLLGNALTGVTLGLDGLLRALEREREAIDGRLALGLSAWQASLPWLRDALRSAMTPTLQSMTVVGIVSLPGMMTGQILAGADPMDAVAYQILVLFMIAATTALASVGLCLTVWWRLADPWVRFRTDAIQPWPSRGR